MFGHMALCCRIEERKMTTAHMGLAGDISGGSGCSAPALEGGGGADACKSADQCKGSIFWRTCGGTVCVNRMSPTHMAQS